MNPDLTAIACVVDRSGSMGSIADDAIGGFNAFVEAQRQEPGRARLSLVLFDHEYAVVHDAVDLRRVPPLDTDTYRPRGTTALLDAVGRTIDDLGKRLAAVPEPKRPGKVIVAILTDGYENASEHYTLDRVASMIEHQKTVYGWEFVFLAANQDAIAAAASLQIDASDAISFEATGAGTRQAFAALSADVSTRRRRAQR